MKNRTHMWLNYHKWLIAKVFISHVTHKYTEKWNMQPAISVCSEVATPSNFSLLQRRAGALGNIARYLLSQCAGGLRGLQTLWGVLSHKWGKKNCLNYSYPWNPLTENVRKIYRKTLENASVPFQRWMMRSNWGSQWNSKGIFSPFKFHNSV